MKISTFPAVKPFIKLTRGRIGVEEEGRGKVTLGEGAGGKQVQSEAERGGKVTVGTEARGRKLSLFGRRRRMRVIWRRAGQTEEAELRVTLKRGLEIQRKTSLTLEYK
ncbi:hypothetical protein CgunFtcFv8_020560 [Champsocephalus gunnari]|uniref:Uncharacterized protein n=1 Tax=Champsocephalus gunnari TaxID=52237 RepID=A0AAN8EFN7_CHAGU|nr:hypothetical protein CgunFtcFv8_020560 [Champsocephalus gunnari]